MTSKDYLSQEEIDALLSQSSDEQDMQRLSVRRSAS